MIRVDLMWKKGMPLFTNLCNQYSSAVNSCAINNATTRTHAHLFIFLYCFLLEILLFYFCT